MVTIKKEKSQISSLDDRTSYFNHKISAYRKPTSILIIMAGLVNLLMLFPDLELIGSMSAKISIVVIRVLYSIILFIISFNLKNIRSFKLFSIIVSISEILAILIFLFVFCQYVNPNFLIQSMGMIMLFLVIFLLPNRWVNMLNIALFATLGFIFCTLVFVKSANADDIIAGFAYVLIALLLCAISARNAEKHQLSEFITKRKLEQISTTDFLTKTANRYKMKEEADKWINFCRRQDMPLSIVFADIDNMKAINDKFGHATGDFVLTSFAALIQKQLRSSDTLARWGGDEFVFLLPNTSFDNAENLTVRIETHINKFNLIEGHKVSCSFGVIQMKEDSDFLSMINEADKLMYDSKRRDKDSL
ncbi:MAG: GGDEF domain-containing protein [Oscillospiraceae bacterium]|nr:GGDEF domain-containing protein [Oscillospiraceae bacterium]